MNSSIDHISPLAIVIVTFFCDDLGLGVVRFFSSSVPMRWFFGRADQPKTSMGALYTVGPSLCMPVTTIVIAVLMAAQRVSSVGGAIGLGALVGVGLPSATAMNMAINPNVPRPTCNSRCP